MEFKIDPSYVTITPELEEHLDNWFQPLFKSLKV